MSIWLEINDAPHMRGIGIFGAPLSVRQRS
jgi:hypothetical protein